jgi:methylthioribose-1-phosphate isomerase
METKSIHWDGSSLHFLDQTALPGETVFRDTQDYSEVIEAIKKLRIRGAPLIGIAASYGMLLAARQFTTLGYDSFCNNMDASRAQMAASRPTAVNLFWALEQVKQVLRVQNTVDGSVNALEKLALEIHEDDRKRCNAIGTHGATLISDGDRILTHCNAGALATGGIGTALGAIFTAHDQGKNIHVYADETRPLLQGSRLTMWELQQTTIPSTLICDNTAAMTMRDKKVSLVITGADRIAANGDSVNKIGTYGLAIMAAHHGIPFYIAAPKSTIDMRVISGDEIPIEERGAEEVTTINGKRLAPEDVDVFAPAFDVTPNGLIHGIVTEDGICRAPYTESLSKLFAPT